MLSGVGYHNTFNQVITSEFVEYTFYQTITLDAPAAQNRVAFGGLTVGDTFEIKDVSVEELGADWTVEGDSSISIGTHVGRDDVADININDALNSARIAQPFTFVSGTSYKVTVEVYLVSGSFRIDSSNTYVAGDFVSTTTTGSWQTLTGYITATASGSNYIWLRSITEISQFYVDSVSVQELGEDWTLQSGWSVGDSKATYDATANVRYINQLLNFELDKSYKIQFTISGGTARIMFTNESGVQLFNNLEKDNYAPDSYILCGTAIASTELRIYAYNTGGGEAFSITDISIQEQDPNDYWTITGNSIWIGNKESVFEDVAQVSNIKNTSFSTITGDDYRLTFKIPALTKGALNWYSSKGLLLNSTPYKAAADEEILDFIGDGSLGVYAVGGNLDNSFSMTNLSIRLKDTGDVKLTLTNQLTEKVTTVDLTPITYNGRYTEFAYQPIDLIEGMYMIKFTGDSGTYANTLAYITTGTLPLSESEYKAYTTGDDNPDHVYIP
jgi:hypothetical protein